MPEIERLIHCYKTGIRFRAWFSVSENGKEVCLTACPATTFPRTVHTKCNGQNEFGFDCRYSAFTLRAARSFPENP